MKHSLSAVALSIAMSLGTNVQAQSTGSDKLEACVRGATNITLEQFRAGQTKGRLTAEQRDCMSRVVSEELQGAQDDLKKMNGSFRATERTFERLDCLIKNEGEINARADQNTRAMPNKPTLADLDNHFAQKRKQHKLAEDAICPAK